MVKSRTLRARGANACWHGAGPYRNGPDGCLRAPNQYGVTSSTGNPQGLAKSKRPPQGGHCVSNRTFFRNQRTVEVPELVIATGLPALITWVDWAVWL